MKFLENLALVLIRLFQQPYDYNVIWIGQLQVAEGSHKAS
jgi:hypothetical protein